MSITLFPVGYVVGGRVQPDDDNWDQEQACIRLDAGRFGPEALAGLDSFSHLEVIFQFHLADPAKIVAGSRHPRGNQDWPKVGIFAQRGHSRPNLLGNSICQILGVDGLEVQVQGLDAIDGTPVLDLKPVMSGFLPRGEVREPAWAQEIMAGYW